MSQPEKSEKSEIFQMQDFYQQLIKFKLDEEKKDWAEPDAAEGRSPQENGKGGPKAAEGDGKKRQKPFAKSFAKVMKEGEFAFGMIPEGKGAEEAIKLADGQNGFAVDSQDLNRNLMPLIFDFGNKGAESKASGAEAEPRPEKAGEGLPRQNSPEKDEDIIIFQISESEILKFFGISDLKTVDVEKLDENEKTFDLFGQILQKNDTRAILQRAVDKKVGSVELLTDERGQKRLVCGERNLDLETMQMEKDGELILVQTDLERRTLRNFGKVDGFYSA